MEIILTSENHKISNSENNKLLLSTSGAADNCGVPFERAPVPLEGHEPVYQLDDPKLAKELEFFKSATGIQEPSLLRSHITKIRDIAYKSFPYPCIWSFEFLKGKSLNHPFYPQIWKEHPRPGDESKVFIDFACFLGIDLRQIVQHGWNPNNVLGIDLHEEMQKLGCQLFNDAGRAPPFFKGDIFSPKILDVSTPATVEAHNSPLDLRALKDLNPLKRRAKFISAHQVFHLFSKDDQRALAERLVLLLSNEPGAAIFGTQLGMPEEGLESNLLYRHSPESWQKMWIEVFGDQKVHVNATVQAADPKHGYRTFPVLGTIFWLDWSVVRI